jgi:hypothetical protein
MLASFWIHGNLRASKISNSLCSTQCFLHRAHGFLLAHIYAHMCTNGHVMCWLKEHLVENILLTVFFVELGKREMRPLIFLGSMANSGLHESMFHRCVVSAECLIILASCLCFILCYRNNSNSFFVCKPTLQTRNDRKVPKHLIRPTFSFVLVLIITIVFSMIESVESTNKEYLKVFVLNPTI